jgi:hypothetical protein
MSQLYRTLSHGAREDVHPASRLRDRRPRKRPARAGPPDVDRRRLRAARRATQCSGVALLASLFLCVAVAPATSSHADGDRSAAELWEAYPLNPQAPDAGAGGPRGDFAATNASRDIAVGSTVDEPDRAVDGRLMLQLGMLVGALYAAFLCIWFAATRGSLGLGGGIDAGGSLRRVRAVTVAVATARAKAERRFATLGGGSSRADPHAVWTCAIGWRAGRLRSRFQAMMAAPDGRRRWVVAQSKRLQWPPRRGDTLATAELVSALEALVAALVAAGWKPIESAGSWSARRFVWGREGEPPARLTIAEEEQRLFGPVRSDRARSVDF